MTISDDYSINQCSAASGSDELTLSKITPAGVETHICFNRKISSGALITLNSEINSIVSQGYKLIVSDHSKDNGESNLHFDGQLVENATFIFAIP